MKKKNFIIVGLSACAICAVIGGGLLSIHSASANTIQNARFKNFNRRFLSEEDREELRENNEERMLEMEARRAPINEALQNSDYSAWLEALGENCPMTEKITQDNFAKFAGAHAKMQGGREIMQELGVERMGFGGNGFKNFGRMKYRFQEQQ